MRRFNFDDDGGAVATVDDAPKVYVTYIDRNNHLTAESYPRAERLVVCPKVGDRVNGRRVLELQHYANGTCVVLGARPPS